MFWSPDRETQRRALAPFRADLPARFHCALFWIIRTGDEKSWNNQTTPGCFSVLGSLIFEHELHACNNNKLVWVTVSKVCISKYLSTIRVTFLRFPQINFLKLFLSIHVSLRLASHNCVEWRLLNTCRDFIWDILFKCMLWAMCTRILNCPPPLRCYKVLKPCAN